MLSYSVLSSTYTWMGYHKDWVPQEGVRSCLRLVWICLTVLWVVIFHHCSRKEARVMMVIYIMLGLILGWAFYTIESRSPSSVLQEGHRHKYPLKRDQRTDRRSSVLKPLCWRFYHLFWGWLLAEINNRVILKVVVVKQKFGRLGQCFITACQYTYSIIHGLINLN